MHQYSRKHPPNERKTKPEKEERRFHKGKKIRNHSSRRGRAVGRGKCQEDGLEKEDGEKGKKEKEAQGLSKWPVLEIKIMIGLPKNKKKVALLGGGVQYS